jgi:uncharacterized protein YkwD
LPARFHRKSLNRWLGVAPGLFKGLVATVLAITVLQALPLSTAARATVSASATATRFSGYTDRVAAVTPIFADAITQAMRDLRPDSEANERIPLPFAIADAQPLPDLEAQMLELVNQERAQAGLAPLRPDPALIELARAHSADMLAHAYLAHVSLDGSDLADRMHSAGIPFQSAGENLALARTLQLAHAGLMHSPGHRANILRLEFGRVGIGIVDGGIYGLMVTQDFRD